MARTTLGLIDGSGPSQRIEVALCQDRTGTTSIELCEQHYGEGVGWFDQRRVKLDARQCRQLCDLMGRGAGACTLRECLETAPATLPFPGPNDRTPRRPAVGS